MKRLVLVAVFLFPGTAVFCQSTANLPGSAQSGGKVAIGPRNEWPLEFGGGQFGTRAAEHTLKTFDCLGRSSTENETSAPIDLDHLFSAPCADSRSNARLFAFNENSFAQIPPVAVPHAKGEPLPNQWPNAKFKPIPTVWPKLKLVPIDGGAAGLVPIRGGTK